MTFVLDFDSRFETETVILVTNILHHDAEAIELAQRLLSTTHDEGIQSELFLLFALVDVQVDFNLGYEVIVFEVKMDIELGIAGFDFRSWPIYLTQFLKNAHIVLLDLQHSHVLLLHVEAAA